MFPAITVLTSFIILHEQLTLLDYAGIIPFGVSVEEENDK
jgi:drug/metabolite transporter (DMT)-like permease